MAKINTHFNVASADNFNQIYFELIKEIHTNGRLQRSRNGDTREFFDFKTTIKHPNYRCVGGYGRDMNIFFLLAEALWIWAGKKDVKFLDMFNSQLKQYSDNGVEYHAPYGFRIRNFGVPSESSNIGRDQLLIALNMLSKNPDDRRVVLQIWNSDLDLGTTSNDIPCNDLWMLKVRDNRLMSTIANRSNDLNLGLTTNVFQFSFMGEIISKILNLELGTQTHNSQSLHVYVETPLYKRLIKNLYSDDPVYTKDLYEISRPMNMDFSFSPTSTAEERLKQVDFFINSMISLLSKSFVDDFNEEDIDFIDVQLKSFSNYLYNVFKLLCVYVQYKAKSIDKQEALELVESYSMNNSDIHLLAENFFNRRLNQQKTSLDNYTF